ncbi:MAG: hypothetical protein QF733_08790, partial [Phycisphaerales bacterium]|nr:hypothetical protein [Phycisphaerales bacterium]
GETAEYRLAEEFQKIRPPAEVWLLRIPESAINAWLATRLPAWLRGRDIDWPDGLGVPQVRAQTGRLTVAMPTAALGGRTGLLTLRPRIKSGMLSCSVTGGIGRVPLPVADRIVRTALAANLPDSEHLAAVSSAIAGDPVDPVFPLIDARAVTLTSVTCEPGAIIIAARTAAADAGD